MVLTEAQLQEIAKRVRAIIRAESKGVGDLPVATSLDGLLSLPALRFNGGVPEVVEAPISKLQDVALDAVSGATKAANEAAAKANTSAGNADKATTAANNAAKSANDAAGTAGAATEAAKKIVAENTKQRAHKEAKLKAEAEELAAKLAELKLTVGAKTSSTGKIFGSVNNIMISEALLAQGFDIDRKKIMLKEIKEVGTYTAVIKLHREVKVDVQFEVVSE